MILLIREPGQFLDRVAETAEQLGRGIVTTSDPLKWPAMPPDRVLAIGRLPFLARCSISCAAHGAELNGRLCVVPAHLRGCVNESEPGRVTGHLPARDDEIIPMLETTLAVIL